MKTQNSSHPAYTADAKMRAWILVGVIIVLTIIITHSVLTGNGGIMAYLTRSGIITHP